MSVVAAKRRAKIGAALRYALTTDNPMEQHAYDVTLTGRAWSLVEWEARHSELPFKPELIRGKLYWTERERLTMLAALLEHYSAAAAVRISDPNVWREAVQALE